MDETMDDTKLSDAVFLRHLAKQLNEDRLNKIANDLEKNEKVLDMALDITDLESNRCPGLVHRWEHPMKCDFFCKSTTSKHCWKLYLQEVVNAN